VSTSIPANILVTVDSACFLFINRFLSEDLDFNNENKVEVYKVGSEKYIDRLRYGSDQDEKYHFIFADTVLPSHSAHESAYNLTIDIINNLSEKYNPDCILTLDNYDLFLDREVEVDEYDDGSKS
jgi:hypothetical protein